MSEKNAAEWVKVRDLKKWDKNPRKNEIAIPEVMKSIEKYGFGAPIVAQRGTNRIIAGHTRLEAAKRLKIKIVPVRYLDLGDKEATELALVDNKSNELADWDISGLKILFDENINLSTLGWMDHEVKFLNDIDNVSDHYVNPQSDIQRKQTTDNSNTVDVSSNESRDKEWVDMPEYGDEEVIYHTLRLHFETKEAMLEFSRAVKQSISKDMKYMYFPPRKNDTWDRYEDEEE